MVSHPRTPLGPHDLRFLNAPISVQVQLDARGEPATVQRRGWTRPRSVTAIQDRWRIDDEWWRERSIARTYYTLLVDNVLLIVYRDLQGDTWFEQRG